MNLILADFKWTHFLPLSFSKPTAHLLVGIDTICEKWERLLNTKPSTASRAHINQAFPTKFGPRNIIVNAATIPSKALCKALATLKEGEVLSYRGEAIAVAANETKAAEICAAVASGQPTSISSLGQSERSFDHPCQVLDQCADIFSLNDDILRQDFAEITGGIKTTEYPNHVMVRGTDIYIHPSAKLAHCVLNAEAGPIYIGEHAEIMEGSLVRGPFALGAHSTLKMGAKIYGATSVGRHCKLGGEVGNSILNDYSNKGHDGFLGNSVIGSWCNLGADTNTSNLKNNYGKVKVWNYHTAEMTQTDLQFHGLIMGDHSKSSINTMFNTGTVVGMCANVFDSGFPPKFVPSFSWGGKDGCETFKIEKAFEAAAAMMGRRNIDLSPADEQIFRFVSDHDQQFR